MPMQACTALIHLLSFISLLFLRTIAVSKCANVLCTTHIITPSSVNDAKGTWEMTLRSFACSIARTPCVLTSHRSFTSAAVPTGAYNLLHRFFHILDAIDQEHTLGSLFVPGGGTMHVPKAKLVLTGGEEIDDWCGSMQQRWAAVAPTLHVESNIIITDTPEVCANRCHQLEQF